MATDPQTLLQNMLSTTAVPTSGGIPPAQSPFATQGPLGPGVMAGPTFGGGNWGGQPMFSQQGLEQINQWLSQQSGQPVVPGGQQPPATPQQPGMPPQQPGAPAQPQPAPPTQPQQPQQPTFSNPIAERYFLQNPDVAAAYRQNSYGLSPDDFATLHYQKFGKNEQRAWGTGPSQSSNPPLTETVPRPTTPTRESSQGVPAVTNPYSPSPAPAPSASPSPAPAPNQQPQFTLENVSGFENRSNMNKLMKAIMPQGGSGPSNDPRVRAYWYLKSNPDVAMSFYQNSHGMDPITFAQTHYQKFGQAEGRKWET